MPQIVEIIPHKKTQKAFILPNKYHGYRCQDDISSQGFSTHGIELVIKECCNFGTGGVINVDVDGRCGYKPLTDPL